MNLTKRQNKYLKLIIDDFIENGEAIGSHNFISKNGLDISSATVRNEMNFLEKEGYLIKESSSSGRIPTTLGYKYYVHNLIKQNDERALELQLNKIFAKRTLGIDITVDEAAYKISEITGLTLITSNPRTDELLKAIQLVPISEATATIIIVTSIGRVESQTININPIIKMKDLRITIRLFQERLIDTSLTKLNEKVGFLKDLLKEKVSNFEIIFQEFVTKIFNFYKKNKANIYGEANIIRRNDITREQLIKIISLLEKKSIWESIEQQGSKDEKLKISIDQENTSIVSRRLNANGRSKEISIVGSHRLNYSKAITILKVIEKFLSSKNKM